MSDPTIEALRHVYHETAPVPPMTPMQKLIEANRLTTFVYEDDEDDDEERTITQWMVDVMLIPVAILLITSVMAALASGAIWTVLWIWSGILTLSGLGG